MRRSPPPDRNAATHILTARPWRDDQRAGDRERHDELAVAARRDPIAYRLAHLDDPRACAVIEAAQAMAARAGAAPGDGFGRGFGFARYKGPAPIAP